MTPIKINNSQINLPGLKVHLHFVQCRFRLKMIHICLTAKLASVEADVPHFTVK